ncbi:uncharacterized protein LOC142635068 [Castanea sativa]|uniref:uncharacterized protein LOC142635068 n=1 Tax=Castanea sativa TaxID=21020 RepID=UPI003F652663
MAKCQQAFKDLKAYLSSPPLQSPSKLGEELFLYLAVSLAAIGAALVREEDKVQKPMYYTSQALRGAEERLGAEEYPRWSIHTDGSSNKQAGGVGIVLCSLEKDKIECMVHSNFPTTNNEAEYEALVAGLDLAKAVGAMSVVIHCDSQVVTNQVNGDYECKSEKMKKYFEQAKKRMDELHAKIVQIPRGENEQTDRLTKAASMKHMITLDKEVDTGSNWTTPLVSYLKDGTLPDDKEATRTLKVQAARFVLIKDILYKRGSCCPYLRCLNTEEANYVMREVHEKVCGNHLGSRSLVHKLIRVGYYWPTTQKDAQVYVKTCDKCQRFGNLIKQPTEELTPMTAPWPFAQWGLDIMGPFPTVVRQLKFLVVNIDYFTKWVEAEALVTITEKNLGIKNHYSSFAHPQANGQVKVMNWSLLKIIKTQHERAKEIWPEEFPSVLWAYSTTIRTPTGETLFRLAYWSEVVI